MLPLASQSSGFYKSIPHLLFFPSTKRKPSKQRATTVFFLQNHQPHFQYYSSPTYSSIAHKPSKREAAMASASRASWIVAASISAVETLKDQGGLCRLNHTMRSLHQKARKEMGSFSQAKKMSSSSSSLMVESRALVNKAEQAKRAEESFRKVMYLSCWGPN